MSEPSQEPTISVVVPFYNEEENIPELSKRLSEAADSWQGSVEFIAVNDGSRDRTLEMLSALRTEDPRWKVLSFSRNFGHQRAVSAGLYYARGDAVIVMDSDLQDPPEVIGDMLTQWREGNQVVYAVRKNRKENFVLRFCYWTFYRLLRKMASIKIPLDSGDFCVMDRQVVDVIRAMPENSKFVRGMRSWAGFRQTAFEYERQERAAGKPKYSITRLIRLALDGLVSFSHAPLKLATWMGFFTSLISFVFMLMVLINYFWPFELLGIVISSMPGRVSFLAPVLFFGGVQLMFLGLIGEYVGRIFDETKDRPRWVIGEAMGIDPPENVARGGWFVRQKR